LTPSQLEDVHSSISSNFKIQGDAVVGIEADPRVTTGEHLRALGGIGFNRLSLGVQDFSLQVQKAIGRIETADVVADMVRKAGAVGFKSINVDLVYGLPLQTLDSFMRTLGEVVSFSPDRIACFNFAYLPRIVPSQSVILKKDLPNREKKFEILCSAISFLSEHGYEFIGIDHFARQEDELCRAQKEKRLWRNFQGYTPKREGATLGLGMSAISEAGDCYAQNSKKLIEYYRGVAALELAKTRGWRLTSDDKARKKVIQDLFCSYCADLSDISFDPDILSGFEKTGLLQINGKKIEVTKLGRLFIRNIASMFDVYTQAKEGYLSRGV